MNKKKNMVVAQLPKNKRHSICVKKGVIKVTTKNSKTLY